MEFGTVRDWFTLENVMDLIQQYRTFGPIPGILLPLLEAFLPFLPLFVVVMANANAFGLWLGFFYSWLGTCIGSLLLFLLIRKFGQKRLLSYFQRHPQVKRLMDWVECHGFGPLFLLLCFPFTPSSVVNIVAGLSKVGISHYILAVSIGKLVMIFTISFIGYDIHSLVTKPYRTIILASIVFILWLAGKRIEAKLNRAVQNDHNVNKDQKKGNERRRSFNED